jgi:hypothetical protein
MLTAIKELIVRNIFLTLFLLTPLISFTQEIREGKLVQDKLISPILKELRSSQRKVNKSDKGNCDGRFLSMKFVVNSKSYKCDTVYYSKSFPQEFKQSINNLSKTLDWLSILGEMKDSNEDFEIILPIHLGRDNCSIAKFTEIELWNIFKELLMTQGVNLSKVIIVSPVSTFSSAN